MPLIPAFPEHADLADVGAFLASNAGADWIAAALGQMSPREARAAD